MLVLHIMVSQVFVLFGRAAPDVEAAQWTQLLGEVQSLPQQKGEAAALDAYHRQAQQLIINRSGKLGIVPESVSIAWDGAQRVQAVILHMPEEAVAALGQTQSASMAVAASDPEAVRTSIAQMLNLPAYAVQIQRGGERLP